MQFDLFTFIAQVINFVILLILLRLVLYRPVIDAMNKREAAIAARLKAAEDKQKEAEQAAQAYQNERSTFESEREQALSEAHKQAEVQRHEWLMEAREEVDSHKQQWLTSIENEKAHFLQDLQRRAETQLVAVMRKALSDLADAELEAQIIHCLRQRIDEDGDLIAGTLRADHHHLTVYSAFELSDEERTEITAALQIHVAQRLQPRFARDPDLIAGVTIHTENYQVGWNLRQYMDGLEAQLKRTLDDRTYSKLTEPELEPK